VRLLLDAQLSERRIGTRLRAAGHDVRSLQAEPELDGLDDEDVLALATADDRILVTRNSRDFAPIAREWAELGRTHAGVILIWTFRTNEFGKIVAAVESVLGGHDSWTELVVGI
jgi:predicted nuclease of predicted toxin-antitoxin system